MVLAVAKLGTRLLGCCNWLLGRGYEVAVSLPIGWPSQKSPAPSLYDLLIQRYDLRDFVAMLSLWDFFQPIFRTLCEHRTPDCLEKS